MYSTILKNNRTKNKAMYKLKNLISYLDTHIWEKLFCEKTSLFYDRICDEQNPFAHLPTPEEISKQFPNPCGWGTGMEDCSINAGHMLEILTLQHKIFNIDVTDSTTKVINGISLCESVHGKHGFLVRGVSPFDKKSCYFNSSRDQVTMVVGGLFDIFNNINTLSDENRTQIQKILFDIATYTNKTITKENNYSYLRLDGGKAIVSKLWDCDVHEMLRLPMIYAAAGEICGSEYFKQQAINIIEEGLVASEQFDKEKYFWDFPLIQMQLSLDILRNCCHLEAWHNRINKLMDAVSFAASREFSNVLEKCENYSGDWNAYCNNWRTLPMRITPETISITPNNAIYDGYTYLNPVYNEDFAIIVEYLRSLGNYLTAGLLAPNTEIKKSDFERLIRFLTKLDFSKCTHAAPFALLHGLLLGKSIWPQ